MADRWNSNLHAFGRLLERIPTGAARGLDVGCGEGETARRLRSKVDSVVGVDPDLASIDLARRFDDGITYLVGDALTVDLPAASFDVVTAVAVLHHLDHQACLERLASFVRPGGRLLVVGLARSRSIGDLARDAFDSIAVRRYTLTTDVWETPAPKVWPPAVTHAQVRAITRATLPGALVERLPYFRYGITWTRPLD
ncbi:MAG: class I SAM-dependent methyltransferase [Acidimicrobiales bacterium]